MNNLYVHIFSFYLIGSKDGIRYVIEDVASVNEKFYKRYNYKSYDKIENLTTLSKIKNKISNNMYKLGKIKTSNKDITNDEISYELSKLGYKLSTIYLKEDDLQFLENIK